MTEQCEETWPGDPSTRCILPLGHEGRHDSGFRDEDEAAHEAILAALNAAQARIAELEADNAELRADLNLVTEGRWTQTEIDACKWRGHELALKLRSYGSAVGGAPGVSETHTDPKEDQQ